MNRHCAECIFLLVFASVLPSVCFAQRAGETVTISGNVYIEKADRPIRNAAVQLCDQRGSVLSEMITSDTGEFSFRGIPAASYMLKISAEGFETLEVTLELNFASDRGVPIYLKPVALKSAELARALSPNSAVIYRLLANIHLRAKDYSALLADIDAYLNLDPDSPAGIRAKQMREQLAQKISGP